MSGDLFSVDGVDIPALINEHLGGRVLPAVLEKRAETQRDPLDPTSAQELTPTRHSCRGFVVQRADRTMAEGRVRMGDRAVILLGASLPAGVVPLPGDVVEVEGDRHEIDERGVARDPASATYTCRVKES